MRDLKRSQQGMVSLVVTVIMMIVITLIIIGITQITRSNQREQIDRQLNTQAYYAAESGLNQAVKFFSTNPTVKLNTNGNCTQFITSSSPNGLQYTLGVDNILSSATNVSYTCLMVNSTPASLQKAPLTQDDTTVWHVQDGGGLNFSQLEFKWTPDSTSQFSGGTNTCSATGFPAYGSWNCAFAILRVDLVDVHGTVSTTGGAGNGLESPAKTLYLVPTFTISGVTTPQSISASTGQVVLVKCSATLCDVKLNPSISSGDYYARLSVIYQDAAAVTLSGTDSNGVATFSGGQAVIDATGKAQDELRRVQARVPLTTANTSIPNFALMSTDAICKQMMVASGAATIDTCP